MQTGVELVVCASITDYEMGSKIAANLTIWLMPGVGVKFGAKSGAARELRPRNYDDTLKIRFENGSMHVMS